MFIREEPRRSIRIKTPLIPILVIILLVVQLFAPNKGWAILLSGFGGVWLISIIWVRSLRKGLKIDRDINYGWKQVGDSLLERISLENNSWLPCLWVDIDDHSNMRDYEISMIAEVGGWRYRNWHSQGYCNYRGLFSLGPVTLKSEDPFGVYEVSVDYSGKVNMMVVPPIVPLPEIDIASGGRVGEGRSSNKGLKQTVTSIGIREYMPGDSLRWLHWPTIARTGNLFVHLFENEPTSDWWILLDMDENVQVGEGHHSTEEHGIILAASLVNRGLQLGRHVGLIAQGDELIWHRPDIGDPHLWTLLRSLATIRPGNTPLAELLSRMRLSLGRNSSLVIITSNPDPDWINALEVERRLGIIPTVVLLDPISFGGEENIDTVSSRLKKLKIRNHIITSDLLDKPEKPKKWKWDWLYHSKSPVEISSGWEKFKKNAGRNFKTWSLILLFYFVFVNLLQGAIRGIDGGLIWFMVLTGLLMGGFLSLLKMKVWIASGLVGLAGFIIALVRVGSLESKVFDLAMRLLQLLQGFYYWAFWDGADLDIGPVQIRLQEIATGLSTIGIRIWGWLKSLTSGNSFYDPVAIATLWGLAVIGVVIWSVWWIIKQNKPLTGFLPALILITLTVSIVGKTPLNLVFMLGVLLTSMILIQHDVREGSWLMNRLSFSSSIRRNVLIASVVLTVGLMIFSLITPSISVQSIADYFRTLSGEVDENESSLAQSLGFSPRAAGGEIDPLSLAREGGLPNKHLLQSSADLSDEIVMIVKIESPQPDLIKAPIYLQSLAYDKYIGSGWESRQAEFVEYSAGDGILLERPSRAIPIRQQIQLIQEGPTYLYSIGAPNSVDQDFKVAWRVRDNENKIFDIFGATVDGDVYRVDSFLNQFTADELRTASQIYPAWIQERYMSLPFNLPEEVLSLSLELTATEPTPYDRAVAIESYLRKIPYSLDVGVGPAGVDVVDYFLFNLKRGYCDHYATAMVVLARAAGIPARYVIGYIGENYNQDEKAYIVTADQAHAWAEVYFSGFGWVPFEPTAGRQAMKRPYEPIPELPNVVEFELPPLVPPKAIPFEFMPIIIFGFFGVLIIVALLIWKIADWTSSRLGSGDLLPKLYKRIYMYGRWANLSIKPGDTPYLFSDMLRNYLSQLGSQSYWAGWLLEGNELISRFTDLFVYVMFNPHHRQVNTMEILDLYKKLRLRLWMLIILGKAYPYRFLRPFFWINTPLLIKDSLEEI